MTNLNLLIEFLSSEKFIDFLRNINFDDFFELRDSNEFDLEWMKNFNSLEKENFSNDDIQKINLLRENTFKTVFNICEDSEIAACISDDIEIITKDILLKNHEAWSVNYLLKYYKEEVL